MKTKEIYLWFETDIPLMVQKICLNDFLFWFKENIVDQCVYHKISKSKFILLVLYVNDILLTNNDLNLLHETKRFLSKNFDIKDLGNASFVLSIQIHCDHS